MLVYDRADVDCCMFFQLSDSTSDVLAFLLVWSIDDICKGRLEEQLSITLTVHNARTDHLDSEKCGAEVQKPCRIIRLGLGFPAHVMSGFK